MVPGMSELAEHRDWCNVCDRYSVHVRRTERLASVTTLFGVPERIRALECTHCHWVERFSVPKS